MLPHPQITVEQLLDALRRGGPVAQPDEPDEADDAALVLGLLLEDRPPVDDGGVASVLGEELARRRLTPAERAAAVDGLVAYVEDVERPRAGAVWALNKGYEARSIP